MTLLHPIGRALTGPADHRHIPQDLDRITGISAAPLATAPNLGQPGLAVVRQRRCSQGASSHDAREDGRDSEEIAKPLGVRCWLRKGRDP